MMTAGHILLSLPCVCIIQPFSLNINIKTAESPFSVKRSVPSMFVQRVGWRVYCATIKVLRVFFVLKMTKAGAKPLLYLFDILEFVRFFNYTCSVASLRMTDLVVRCFCGYQITTLLEGARYIPSVFLTLKVAYHSGKFLGGMLVRR